MDVGGGGGGGGVEAAMAANLRAFGGVFFLRFCSSRNLLPPLVGVRDRWSLSFRLFFFLALALSVVGLEDKRRLGFRKRQRTNEEAPNTIVAYASTKSMGASSKMLCNGSKSEVDDSARAMLISHSTVCVTQPKNAT